MENKKSFEDLLAFGIEGEHEVANLLLNRGAKVMPLYQFETSHAPYIISKDAHFTSPDLICFNNKRCFFVEVKTKNQWVSWKNRLETGIDKRLFNEYKKIKELTKIEIYLFFNHKKKEPTGFFYCEIDNFTREWDGIVSGKKVYKAMIFYSFEKLKQITN